MIDFISKVLFCSLMFFVISCDSQEGGTDKDFVIVKKIDKFVDVVLDKEGGVYIRNSISEQCGHGKYFYNNSMVLGETLSKDMLKVSLNSRIDLDSLKLVKVDERYYKLEDIKYIYSLYITMCDSNIVVDLKQ